VTAGIQPHDAASVSGTLALGPLPLDSGEVVGGLSLHYRVYGDAEAARVNGWILVFHALTGSAEIDAWWGGLLGPGRALDTARHAVVAANLPGSCYGSTGPREWRDRDGGRFPAFTTRDLARAHEPLLDRLGVERVALATGGSLGGMVALQWGAITARAVDRLAVLAAPAVTSSQSIAWNVAQRMALEADPRWRGGRYDPADPPAAGLAAARAIAMITYRSSAEFDERFGRRRSRQGDGLAVDAYLRRHGEKLVERFDAASYVALTEVMDRHDVGPLSEAAAATARRVRHVVGVGVDTDILYPAVEVRGWVDQYRAHGAPATYAEIQSIAGHDAFLIELDQVGRILTDGN
jgi:homoserine O-acetyltransferase